MYAGYTPPNACDRGGALRWSATPEGDIVLDPPDPFVAISGVPPPNTTRLVATRDGLLGVEAQQNPLGPPPLIPRHRVVARRIGPAAPTACGRDPEAAPDRI